MIDVKRNYKSTDVIIFTILDIWGEIYKDTQIFGKLVYKVCFLC